MWASIVRHIPSFASAVLSAIDPDGYPASVRCRPRLERAAGLLWLDLPAEPALLSGPASLLCHSHDECLGSLRSCALVGALRRDQQGAMWSFVPARFIPGAGIDGLLGGIRFVVHGRRVAAQYLARRGLNRPQVDWDELQALLTAGRDGEL